MAEKHINPQPQKGENMRKKKNAENFTEEHFESDSQKIVRRHLENKDDIITEKDIASVRVGMTPPQFDEATAARFEGEEAREKVENESVKGAEDMNKDENLDDEKITPWDIIDPTK